MCKFQVQIRITKCAFAKDIMENNYKITRRK